MWKELSIDTNNKEITAISYNKTGNFIALGTMSGVVTLMENISEEQKDDCN